MDAALGADAHPAAPDAAPDAPPAGDPFFAISPDQATFDPAQAALLARLGAGMVRLQLCDWPASQATLDAQVDAARAAGLAVYAELNYCTLPAPPEPAARQALWHAQFSDGGNAFAWDFAEAAGEIAAHFAGRVVAYEIWNEPGGTPRPHGFPAPYWPSPGNADWDGACGGYAMGVDYGGGAWDLCPRQLAVVTTNTFMAIRAADPAAKVVMGNLLLHGEDGWVARSYLDAVLAAPAVTWFREHKAATYGRPVPWDIVAIHPYGFAPGEPLAAQLAGYRARLDAAGDPSPLALSEVGWHTGDEGDPYHHADPATQAAYLEETLAQARAANLAFVVWFNYLDAPSYGLTYGLRGADGTWKPAARAYCAAAGARDCPAP